MIGYLMFINFPILFLPFAVYKDNQADKKNLEELLRNREDNENEISRLKDKMDKFCLTILYCIFFSSIYLFSLIDFMKHIIYNIDYLEKVEFKFDSLNLQEDGEETIIQDEGDISLKNYKVTSTWFNEDNNFHCTRVEDNNFHCTRVEDNIFSNYYRLLKHFKGETRIGYLYENCKFVSKYNIKTNNILISFATMISLFLWYRLYTVCSKSNQERRENEQYQEISSAEV